MIVQATNQIGNATVPETSTIEPVVPTQAISNSHSPNDDGQSASQSESQNANQSAPQVSENQVSDALKKVGIKAEIDFSNQGYIIVRYVDPQSKQVVLQLPNQTVIALVANLSQVFHESDPTAAGAMIDQRA